LSADNAANDANNAPYPAVLGASIMDNTLYAAAAIPLLGAHGPSTAAYTPLYADNAPLLATDDPFGARKITNYWMAHPT
jgi:hypothetical protein